MSDTATDSTNQDPPGDSVSSVSEPHSVNEDALDARIARIVDERLAAQSPAPPTPAALTDRDAEPFDDHDLEKSAAPPFEATPTDEESAAPPHEATLQHEETLPEPDLAAAPSDTSTVSVPQSPPWVIEQDEAAADDEALDRAVRGSQTPDDEAGPAEEPTMQLGSSAEADHTVNTDTKDTDTADIATADADTIGEPTLVMDRPESDAVSGEPVSPAVEEPRDPVEEPGNPVNEAQKRPEPVEAIAVTKATTSTAATLALIFGVTATICAFAPELTLLAVVLGVLALLFGIIGTTSARKPHVTGRALAVIGLLLGLVGLGIGGASIAGYEIDGVNDRSTIDDVRQELLDLRDRVADQLGL